MNDIIYHDRTEFDEFVAVLVSDYQISSSVQQLKKVMNIVVVVAGIFSLALE